MNILYKIISLSRIFTNKKIQLLFFLFVFTNALLYLLLSRSGPTIAAEITTTWQAQYYNNMLLQGTPVLTRSEQAIDYDWGIGSPNAAVSSDEFSARWTSNISVTAGNYRFTTTTDDGVRVYVDGELVIDQWNVQLATEHTADIPLTAGQHVIVMEYFDRWWVASAGLIIEDVPYTMAVTANEPGVQVVVDGEAQDIPYTLESRAGTTHTVYAPSPQTTSDGRTVEFVSWSDGGAKEHTFTSTPGMSLSAAYQVVTANPIFENGFEEGNTSAYPQPNIDIREGNTLEVTTNHPRTGSYSLEVSTGGTQPTSVIDQLFTKRNTIYTRTHVSLPSDYSLEPGAAHNMIIYKTDDFRNGLWITLGPDYRLSPVYFNDEGVPTFPGGFGPALPRDGSWHEIQARFTVDTEHGQVELWLDGVKIAHFTDVNTGQPGRDDIGVTTWGSYFSTVSNNHRLFFDDLSISPAFISNTSEGFQTTTIVSELFLPTYAVYAPDGRIFIAHKDGTIRVVKDGILLEEPLVVIPNVNTYQDRGLNSIALDPNFATNGYMYVAYTHDVNPDDFTGVKASRVIRLTITGDTAPMASQQIVLGSLVGTPANPSCDSYPAGSDCIPSDARTHSIDQLLFMSDGTLIVSNGDGSSDLTVNNQAMRAQSLTSLSGKIIRINTDGTGVADNPFYTGNPNDNRSKIWAYGMRNPFRFSIKPGTDTLFVGDVGWGSWEEINVVEPGQNFGWPCFEGDEFLLGYSTFSLCQTLQNNGTTVEPLHFYPHPPSSAVVGGAFYSGTEYPQEYQGAYFFGDYARNSISTLQVTPENALVPNSVNQIIESADGPVQIFTGPNGNINYLSINTGQLREIQYVRNGFRPIVLTSATPTSGPTPLDVHFSSAGSNDPEGGALSYYWNFGDGNSSTLANPAHTFTTAGIYDVRLTVADPQNLTSSSVVRVSVGNTAPVGTILTPLVSDLYSVNQTIAYSAEATDNEDGVLASENLSWEIIMHHCEVTTNTCHVHPFLTDQGATGSFVAPDHGAGSYFELRLTSRDSSGLTSVVTRELHPEEIALTLNSVPLRTTLVLDGEEYTTPATVNVIANSSHSIFAVSPQTIEDVDYEFTSWSNGQSQNHTFAIGSAAATLTANFVSATSSTQKVWNSYDTIIQSGSTSAQVTDTAGTTLVPLDLYESANDNGVTAGTTLNTYRATAHPEGFNALSSYWTRVPGDFGEYPYIGKNNVGRSLAGGETNAPAPQNVFDMQMSPPENEHLIVAAFTIPEDGTYTVSNLATRRVLGWGGTTSFKVFNPSGTELTNIEASSQAWNTDSNTYTLNNASAGDKIYFAVDRNGDFVGDATEIAWTVTQTGDEEPTPTPSPTPTGTPAQNTWNSYDTELLSGATQARILSSNGSITAVLELYESSNADGVDLAGLFPTYISGNHPEGFNGLSSFWRKVDGGYPYIGKSSSDRGTDAGETGTPSPTGVKDIQIHPGENENLSVVAFIAPQTGNYTVANLAARRVLGWGDSSTFKIFNSDKEMIASIAATSLAWSTLSPSYDLGTLTAGDRIYFALDRDGSFVGDATEITWSVTRN